MTNEYLSDSEKAVLDVLWQARNEIKKWMRNYQQPYGVTSFDQTHTEEFCGKLVEVFRNFKHKAEEDALVLIGAKLQENYKIRVSFFDGYVATADFTSYYAMPMDWKTVRFVTSKSKSQLIIDSIDGRPIESDAASVRCFVDKEFEAYTKKEIDMIRLDRKELEELPKYSVSPYDKDNPMRLHRWSGAGYVCLNCGGIKGTATSDGECLGITGTSSNG